jgi:hypothetical protein
VFVLHQNELTDWFTTREASLESGQIEIIYEWARRSTTWLKPFERVNAPRRK